ncbi:MAG: DedA family protein [Acidobacteria bacterium]|nr:MAG: DedA family protein [Acidobacteriota bacterium]
MAHDVDGRGPAGSRWWRRAYGALLEWAASKSGIGVIGAVSFAEASFFPVPPDVLLAAAVLARREVWLRAALVCSLASIAGGAAGYLIGWGVWEAVSELFYRYVPGFTPELYQRVAALYARYDFWIVFGAGFTPIPYKVFTIAGGVARIDFPVFLLASAVSRSSRFFLVAGLLRLFGPTVKPFVDRHLGWVTLAVFLLGAAGFAALHALR